jgi:hypothetical protein
MRTAGLMTRDVVGGPGLAPLGSEEGAMTTVDGRPSSFGRRLSSLAGMFAGDHDWLDRTFQAIARRALAGDFEEFASEWSSFQEDLMHHLEAEENHVIALLAVERPSEAEVLLDEHARLRVSLLRLAFDFDRRAWSRARADGFACALRAHANRQDRTFFPRAYRPFDPADGARRGTSPGFGVLPGA